MIWQEAIRDAYNRIREAGASGGVDAAKAIARKILNDFKAIDAPNEILLTIGAWVAARPVLKAAVSGATTVMGAATQYYSGLDASVADIRRLTGNIMAADLATKAVGENTSEYVGNLLQVQKETALLGSTNEKVITAQKELYASSRIVGLLFTNNTTLAREQVMAYSKLAIQLDALGISNKSFAATLDIVGKTYRMTDVLGTTEQLNVHFVNLQRATGISAETIATDFAAAAKDLAAYTYPEMLAVFSGLEAQVAATGVSLDVLMGITKKFDTFESAASAVGDLNAMLGGPYLNTLDMINATEEERISLLQDMMEQGGKTWETMGRFERKAIAEALGTSVQDAARLMQGTRGEMDGITGSLQENMLSLEDMLGITEAGLLKAKDGAAANAVALKSQLEGLTQASLGILEIYEQIRASQMKIFEPWAANIGNIKDAVSSVIGDLSTLFGRLLGPVWNEIKDFEIGGKKLEDIIAPTVTKAPAAPTAPVTAVATVTAPEKAAVETTHQVIAFKIGETTFKELIIPIVDNRLAEQVNVFA